MYREIIATYFVGQEYRRAAHILKGADNDKSIFLRCYALYLAGEKRQEEERIELSGVLGTAQTLNEVLHSSQRSFCIVSLHGLPAYQGGKLIVENNKRVLTDLALSH